MKRLLCLILALLSLSFCSCEAVLDCFVDTDPYTFVYSSQYMTFEELILDTDHIVEIKCIEKENDYYYEYEALRKKVTYTFVVTKVIHGTIEEGVQFSFKVGPECVDLDGHDSITEYGTIPVSFKKGNRYMMLLNEFGEAPDLKYSECRDLIMPLNDLSKSTIYDGQPIAEHTANPDAFSSKEALIAYIQELVAQAPANSPSTD